MQTEELLFFDPMPQALPLYQALREHVAAACPDLRVKVSKTQISFYHRRLFAMVSLPLRRRKGWPPCCLVVTFGLGRRAESPRILQAIEPYPGRWTHHVPVETTGDLDAELFAWLDEACRVARSKR